MFASRSSTSVRIVSDVGSGLTPSVLSCILWHSFLLCSVMAENFALSCFICIGYCVLFVFLSAIENSLLLLASSLFFLNLSLKESLSQATC